MADDNVGKVPNSHLEAIRRSLAKNRKGRTVDLAIPGYDGKLIIRCNPVDPQVMHDLTMRIEDTSKDQRGEAEVDASCDLIQNHTIDILGSMDGMDVQLDAEAPPGTKLVFGPRLAIVMGLATSEEEAMQFNGRSLIRAMFPTKLAIMGVQRQLIVWSQTLDTDIGREVEGNSLATQL